VLAYDPAAQAVHEFPLGTVPPVVQAVQAPEEAVQAEQVELQGVQTEAPIPEYVRGWQPLQEEAAAPE